ncbi:MAG: FAD-binding oxidoreductase [Neomegalonema sp.]|nr:FAD-binding oxidoreductase [Neomegalonema sp.]
MNKPLNTPSDAFLSGLRDLLGPKGVVESDDSARFLEEPRGQYHGHAALIARPADTGQVAEIVRRAAIERVGVVPYGGGTGLVGGQLLEPAAGPPPIVLSLERMKNVRDVSVADAALTVEAGVTVKAAQEAAEGAGLLFPLSYGSEGTAQIGGALATNAGGVQVLRYGNTRDLVLGLEAVMPDGTVLNGLKTLRKDNTGFDIRHLLIGSEGALGVVTAATLRLFAQPKRRETAFLKLAEHRVAPTALRALQAVVGEQVTAFELMSETGLGFVMEKIEGARMPLADRSGWHALVEVSGGDGLRDALETALGEAFEQGWVVDAVLAESEAQRQELWRLREEMPIANRMIGAVCSHDVSVPISKLCDFIDAADAALAAAFPGLRVNCFGHLGDGNLHYNAFPPAGEERAAWRDRAQAISRIVHDQTHAFGGSFSAEHGVGRLKPGDLERYGDPAKVAAIRSIKAALDPLGIMNPGAVVAIGEAPK